MNDHVDIQCVQHCNCGAIDMSHTKAEIEESHKMLLALAEKLQKQREQYMERQ